MALQKILTQKYIDSVFTEVSNGVGLNRFKEDAFPYDESKLLVIPNMKAPENLSDKMVPTTDGDYQSAIALYEAYKTLTPLQAIQSQFWESLSLVDLFPYMRDRWGLKSKKDELDLKKNILNHFSTKSHGYIRQGLAGLWWLVYLTVDNESENPYDLTEMLFKNYTLRFIRFGAGKIIQNKEAAIGILQYLKDNEKNISSMESVANGLTSYFNKLGAVKQLSFMDRHFFYHEMATHIKEFSK